jgi:hypothetical protein
VIKEYNLTLFLHMTTQTWLLRTVDMHRLKDKAGALDLAPWNQGQKVLISQL